MTNLAELDLGTTGTIRSVGAIGPMRRRLMDMGLVPGETVKVIKVAPLGDPIEIAVKSYHLSLRRSEAAEVAVEVTP